MAGIRTGYDRLIYNMKLMGLSASASNRSERLDIYKIYGGFINILGRIKSMMLSQRH